MAKHPYFYSLAGLATLLLTMSSCSSRYQNCDEAAVVDETYVHKYGVAVPSDFWTSSGEDGCVVSTMADGVVITRHYTSGVLNGETTYTYPHSSQVQKSESYAMGTLFKQTDYYFDGTPKTQVAYNSPSPGMRSVASWYLSGTPRSIENYCDYQMISGNYYTPSNQQDTFVNDGQGTRLTRDDYGQLISTDTIQNGEMVLRQTYHPNGSPREMIPYRNGKIDGTKRSYQPAGEPDTFEQWVAGQQEGTTVVFQHGEKFAEVPYANGEKHGVECRMKDGSTRVQEITWYNGQVTGPMTTYVGDTVKTDWYFRGKPVSKADYEFMFSRTAVR